MTYHIYPDNDLQQHDTESSMCACHPKIEYEDGHMLIIHNSFDGRELLEQVQEILKIKEE